MIVSDTNYYFTTFLAHFSLSQTTNPQGPNIRTHIYGAEGYISAVNTGVLVANTHNWEALVANIR